MDRDAESQFAMFFRTEYPGVVRTAYLILRDQESAADVAQGAFMKTFTHWGRVARYDRPDAWVRKVAVHDAISVIRKRRFHLAAVPENLAAPEQQLYDADLMNAVADLPPAQRVAVVLFYFEDRPVAQIAEIMDCSTSTAKVHLHRARKRLAERLGEEAADVS